MVDVRKVIVKELARTKRTRYWLARESGLPLATIYNYLSRQSDVNGTTIERILTTLKLEVKSSVAAPVAVRPRRNRSKQV